MKRRSTEKDLILRVASFFFFIVVLWNGQWFRDKVKFKIPLVTNCFITNFFFYFSFKEVVDKARQTQNFHRLRYNMIIYLYPGILTFVCIWPKDNCLCYTAGCHSVFHGTFLRMRYFFFFFFFFFQLFSQYSYYYSLWIHMRSFCVCKNVNILCTKCSWKKNIRQCCWNVQGLVFSLLLFLFWSINKQNHDQVGFVLMKNFRLLHDNWRISDSETWWLIKLLG